MSAMAGPIGPDELGDLLAVEDDAGTVTCQVCTTELDAVTGEPVEPVTPDMAAAAQQYVLESGQNELVGEALI